MPHSVIPVDRLCLGAYTVIVVDRRKTREGESMREARDRVENPFYHYYVTVMDGRRIGFLAGPFRSHRIAAAFVKAAKRRAEEVNSRAVFYAYGVSRFKGHRDVAPKAVLNSYLEGVS
jgi:hypothetical protein